MVSYRPGERGRLWFVWPFWSDTLEPLLVAIAIGSGVGSLYRGQPNIPALLAVVMSYIIAIASRFNLPPR